MPYHLSTREYRSAPADLNTAATPVARLAGKPMYRVPVLIRRNSSRLCKTVSREWITVIARGAADAANWVIANAIDNRPETEVIAIGPKGGEVLRYNGWNSCIGRELFSARQTQLNLEINNV